MTTTPDPIPVRPPREVEIGLGLYRHDVACPVCGTDHAVRSSGRIGGPAVATYNPCWTCQGEGGWRTLKLNWLGRRIERWIRA